MIDHIIIRLHNLYWLALRQPLPTHALTHVQLIVSQLIIIDTDSTTTYASSISSDRLM